MTENISIIGGGIAGLMLGCVAKINGRQCKIYEKSGNISTHGAGISLSPNTTKLFEKIGILEDLIEESCAPIDVVWRKSDGEIIKKIEMKKMGQVLTTNRQTLVKILYNRFISLGGEIEFSYELREINGNKITFENQESVISDTIIGADGIKSLVRTKYFTSDIPKFSGYTAWRGIGSSDSKRINIYLGKNSHIVCYPINKKLETSFVGILRNNKINSESWREEGTKEELLSDLSEYGDFIHQLFKSSQKVYRWGIYDRPTLNSYSKSNIILIGDSAHPMMPFLGQGGSMAIEDSYILGNLFAKINNIDKVKMHFDQLRVKRANGIKKSSKVQGYLNHIKSPVLQKIRNYLLDRTNIAMRRTQNIYNYDALEELESLNI